MSERITAANLDEVIKRNEVIEEQMKQSASLIWSKYNPMQINSPIQLALQILRPYGLIQLPIDNHYLSGAIFVRDGKRIPLINTALPRANQYFTAWHEIYHLLFDEVSFDHLIESEILMEERKAEYFAALMLLGNLMPYFEGLKDMEFQAKAFQCMNAFQAPYKAVLISLYESAVKNGNTAIANRLIDFLLKRAYIYYIRRPNKGIIQSQIAESLCNIFNLHIKVFLNFFRNSWKWNTIKTMKHFKNGFK